MQFECVLHNAHKLFAYLYLVNPTKYFLRNRDDFFEKMAILFKKAAFLCIILATSSKFWLALARRTRRECIKNRALFF
ncbi:MAG: hypothetical protein HY22_04100 [[Candidatus Thermochlorobacteriaceae] bacterium GBChlB]|nr:MAG: hypothetical protein HY22_04100 [[Candidatus Thermochlorobacteriaceae] bacterium GBChlB]